MTLRLAPDGKSARITIPRWGRTGEALAFARSRSAWLASQLAKLPEEKPFDPAAPLLFRGETVPIKHSSTHIRRPVLLNGSLQCGGPEEGLEKRIVRWLEGEALALFASDAACFADRAGVETPEIRLSRARRRWGSCSATGTLRLNWRLVMAPDEVRRSVVAHEIAHLVHFDHSPAFHTALAQIFDGDLPAADRWLKERGRTLYAPFG